MNRLPGNAGPDGWYDPGRSKRRRAGYVAWALVSVVVVGAGGFGLVASSWPFNQSTAALSSPAPGARPAASTVPAAAPLAEQRTAAAGTVAPPPPQDAEQVTLAFLQAWSGGAAGTAAGLTDDPAAAAAALTAYGQDLNLKQLAGTLVTVAPAPTPADGATAAAGVTARETVRFAVRAAVAASAAAGAPSGTWSYQSALTAYQAPGKAGWLIQWAPDVIAPNLADGEHLAAVLVPPGSTTATDSAGNPLASYGDPGLASIASRLAGSAPTKPGTPGLSVVIENAAGQPVTVSPAAVTAPGAGQVATTISPRAERAARGAVAAYSGSAMVAVQPSTGAILAIANNAGFNDFALTAGVAPGSVMKIITATALIDNGLVSEASPVECPATYTVQSITYRNDGNGSEPPGTPFSTDFAQSCNNAFSQWWPRLSGQLASTAQAYYGLNQAWNIGLPGTPASYFNAPADAAGSELAQEAFGEGKVTASPLAMASVAATVESGQFRQPVLVPGTPAVPAAALPASTDAQLKDMMRDVVTEGTADMVGFGPDVYAKTGTADVAGQEEPNSWMAAFDPAQDVAVAALVLSAGYGAQAAGPEVRAFLGAY